MQLRIVLLYIWMVNNVNPEEKAPPPGPATVVNERTKRKDVKVTEPPKELGGFLPVLARSEGVPNFAQYDNQFTSLYPMQCGANVKPLTTTDAHAR
ncbi:unnamed protein product [Haemonchus placei]|uniref:Secreted protein n=1 Tax=Haemonchus placei TaxID=6290 RepID=A0A0N4WWB0_HAEPC|nr:unnamed protein product [Haemonchus placei]